MTPPGLKVRIRFPRGLIELSGSEILLHGTIPGIGQEFFKPACKRGQFISRQLCDSRFKFSQTHRIPPP